MTFPPLMESGFTCDGCTRDGRDKLTDSLWWYPPKVYLQHQAYEHISGCDLAQGIIAGVYLTKAKEKELVDELIVCMLKYLPYGTETPEELNGLRSRRPHNLKSDEFMQWHAKKLSRIIELGQTVYVYDNNAGILHRSTAGACVQLSVRREGLVDDGPDGGAVGWPLTVAKGASFIDGTSHKVGQLAKDVTTSSTRRIMIPKAPSSKLGVPETEDESAPPWRARTMCARARGEAKKNKSAKDITEDDNMSYIELTTRKMELQQISISTAADSPLAVKKKNTKQVIPFRWLLAGGTSSAASGFTLASASKTICCQFRPEPRK